MALGHRSSQWCFRIRQLKWKSKWNSHDMAHHLTTQLHPWGTRAKPWKVKNLINFDSFKRWWNKMNLKAQKTPLFEKLVSMHGCEWVCLTVMCVWIKSGWTTFEEGEIGLHRCLSGGGRNSRLLWGFYKWHSTSRHLPEILRFMWGRGSGGAESGKGGEKGEPGGRMMSLLPLRLSLLRLP